MEQGCVYLVQNRHRRVESERLHVRNARRVWRQMATEVIAGTVQLGFTLMDSVDVCRVPRDRRRMEMVGCARHVQRVRVRREKAVHALQHLQGLLSVELSFRHVPPGSQPMAKEDRVRRVQWVKERVGRVARAHRVHQE
jgi:hypothetical protein